MSTSFWFDVWTPFGQLINHIGPRGPRALRLRTEATVADAISGSAWSLPHPRLDQEVELHSYLSFKNYNVNKSKKGARYGGTINMFYLEF